MCAEILIGVWGFMHGHMGHGRFYNIPPLSLSRQLTRHAVTASSRGLFMSFSKLLKLIISSTSSLGSGEAMLCLDGVPGGVDVELDPCDRAVALDTVALRRA